MAAVLCIYRLAINESKILREKLEKCTFGVHFLCFASKIGSILLDHKFLKNVFV